MLKCTVSIESAIVDTNIRNEVGSIQTMELFYIVLESPSGARIAHYAAMDRSGLESLQRTCENIRNLTTPNQLNLSYWYEAEPVAGSQAAIDCLY